MMLDIVQAIVEWLLPIFLPFTQKTSIMSVRSQEPETPPILTSKDLNTSDPVANIFPSGLTPAHFMMVAFMLVAVWMIISNFTVKMVERSKTPKKWGESVGFPLKGADEDSSSNFWLDNSAWADLKLKWMIQRHETNLKELRREQIEQDIKLAYLSKRLSRREHQDIVRRRPESDATKDPESSEDENDITEKRCKCAKPARPNRENDTMALERHGDQVVEGKKIKDEVGLNAFGQGDAGKIDQFSVPKSPGRPNPRQRASMIARAGSDYRPSGEIIKLIKEHLPSKPPPRPDLPSYQDLLRKTDVLAQESTGSRNLKDAASAVTAPLLADDPLEDDALAAKAPSPAERTEPPWSATVHLVSKTQTN